MRSSQTNSALTSESKAKQRSIPKYILKGIMISLVKYEGSNDSFLDGKIGDITRKISKELGLNSTSATTEVLKINNAHKVSKNQIDELKDVLQSTIVKRFNLSPLESIPDAGLRIEIRLVYRHYCSLLVDKRLIMTIYNTTNPSKLRDKFVELSNMFNWNVNFDPCLPADNLKDDLSSN